MINEDFLNKVDWDLLMKTNEDLSFNSSCNLKDYFKDEFQQIKVSIEECEQESN